LVVVAEGVQASGEDVCLADQTGRFFDGGYVFDFAASVAIAWDCGAAPAGDKYGVFDGVGDLVGDAGLADGSACFDDEFGGDLDGVFAVFAYTGPSGSFGCVSAGL
jgi:hypothetical protein